MHLVNGISDVADKFDTFLLDMWGVMHDGSRPYDGVLEVVQKLRQEGKKLIILSNSSKRTDNSVKMLRKLGFDPEDFENIITSGEVAYQMLSGKLDLWDVLSNLQGDESKTVFVFGSGDDDQPYCESCGWKLAPMNEAKLIVARGTFTVNDGVQTVNKRENAALYESKLEEELRKAAELRIPMLVTNPDKIRPDVERPPMPGKIADRYEQILHNTLSKSGDSGSSSDLVKRVGKPFNDVYDLALGDSAIDRSRVCMVGDALETDIVGAAASGVSSLWVLLDGIHGPDLDVKEEKLMASAGYVVREFNERGGTYAGDRLVSPNIVLRHFRW
eukprot:CAMPEP_0172442798 /NCGR_PEP_ID=MMETSP1065-20121228/3187_1 /TAXON_ID=265537 /ORGANISM="Amphiprora paludosa, Strain CCMP125" /LENGTH=329 /DNA_ID=CAMNT_0013192827 /DNA_START=223 /DNA_END=1212 /DNA_ORIENTATION=+